MAKFELTDSTLKVHLNMAEVLTALHGDLTIPVSKIRGAQVLTPKFWFKLGVRLPGTGLPPFYMAGTYVGVKDRAFVVWNRKQTPVQVDIDDYRFTRVVIGVDNAEEWAANISAAAKI